MMFQEGKKPQEALSFGFVQMQTGSGHPHCTHETLTFLYISDRESAYTKWQDIFLGNIGQGVQFFSFAGETIVQVVLPRVDDPEIEEIIFVCVCVCVCV